MNQCRHIYLGANTRSGFSGFYNQLLVNDDCKLYILKGGPGTGKSTFIKSIVRILQDRDFDIDIIHCSADPSSLDGLICEEAGLMIADGTAPHCIDPLLPGARDEIINLGDFWDKEYLHKFKDDIAAYNRDKAAIYSRAYNYLKAAGAIYDDSNAIIEAAMEKDKIHIFAQRLASEILYNLDEATHWGTNRDMFATAITPTGLNGDVNHLFAQDKVYSIKTFYGTHASAVLKTVRKAALCRGFNTESFYCGFDSNILEHLFIPELGTAIVTSNDYHQCGGSDSYFDYPLDGFLCEYSVFPSKDDLKYNKIRFDELMDKAVRTLFKARQIHSELESIYTPGMDFDALNSYLKMATERMFYML